MNPKDLINTKKPPCPCGSSDFMTRFDKTESGLSDNYLFYYPCQNCGTHWECTVRTLYSGRMIKKIESSSWEKVMKIPTNLTPI